MAVNFRKSYDPAIEKSMRSFYESLPEKDRRRYAAVEAQKLGYGGQSYVARVVGCDRCTIAEGLKELDLLPETEEMASRTRQPGAGRKKLADQQSELVDNFFLC